MESACPMAITTSRLIPFILFARSSSFDLPSGLITDLSKSNSTSAAKVIFSATGFGLAASGAGFGAAGAGVEGAGAGIGAGAGAGAGASCVAHPAANASAPSQSHVFVFILSLPPCLKLLKNVLVSRVCKTLEGILPHPPSSVQTDQGFRQQCALAHARLAVYPNVGDVLASGGIDELRYRVVARGQFRTA